MQKGRVLVLSQSSIFGAKIQKSGIRNSTTYRLPNSRKSNFATEPHQGRTGCYTTLLVLTVATVPPLPGVRPCPPPFGEGREAWGALRTHRALAVPRGAMRGPPRVAGLMLILACPQRAGADAARRRPTHARAAARRPPSIQRRDGQHHRQQPAGFCRKVRFLGQNPKIGYQKFNDLQTAKLSQKQLCDRTDRSPRRSAVSAS